MHGKLKYLLSGIIVLVAVGVFVAMYWDYVTNPWTRDGSPIPGPGMVRSAPR
jgi:hypothetical protein